MGLLMERDPPSWHPATPATKALCKQAAALCREEGVDLAKLALHFCLREERVATTLISSTSLTRMHSAWVDTRAAQASPSWCSGGLSLSASGHASGCPKLRPASANQPLGPRWPALTPALLTPVVLTPAVLVDQGAPTSMPNPNPNPNPNPGAPTSTRSSRA